MTTTGTKYMEYVYANFYFYLLALFAFSLSFCMSQAYTVKAQIYINLYRFEGHRKSVSNSHYVRQNIRTNIKIMPRK